MERKTISWTRFYEELNKLRLPDKQSPTGLESDRAMGNRLGIHNKTITLYKRGAIPHAATIRNMVKKGGYNTDTLYRLLGAAANDSQEDGPISERAIPVFRPEDFVGGIPENIEPQFRVNVPMELNVIMSRSSLVGLLLDKNDNSCEPRIPRGFVVVFSNQPCDPEKGKLYVFCGEAGASMGTVRMRGTEIWRSHENLNDLRRITQENWAKNCLGVVVAAQGFMEDFLK
jgi:hypothetical protein